jgi:hypothetical protein
MCIHVYAVDPGLEIQHAAGFPLLEHDVVERQRARRGAVGADDARLQHGALVAFATALERGVHRGQHVPGQHVGEETQPAAIDADERHPTVSHQPRGI